MTLHFSLLISIDIDLLHGQTCIAPCQEQTNYEPGINQYDLLKWSELYVETKALSVLHAVSYTHLDVYKRQELADGVTQVI